MGRYPRSKRKVLAGAISQESQFKPREEKVDSNQKPTTINDDSEKVPENYFAAAASTRNWLTST